MRVSIGQFAATTDKAANLSTIEELVGQASGQGSRLLVLPEMVMYCFSRKMDDAFVAAAEEIPGGFSRAITAMAARYSIGIVAGMTEATAGGSRPFNTVYVAGPDGEQLAGYRKVHLYDAFAARESDTIAPSNVMEPAVFDLDGIRFGVATCYDVRFPESFRAVIDHGADVVVLPAAWAPGAHKEDHWKTLVRARAIENTSYVLAAGQVPPQWTGGSLAVDPVGVVLAELGERPGIASVEVSKDRVSDVRKTNPCLSNRRFRVERVAEPPTAASTPEEKVQIELR